MNDSLGDIVPDGFDGSLRIFGSRLSGSGEWRKGDGEKKKGEGEKTHLVRRRVDDWCYLTLFLALNRVRKVAWLGLDKGPSLEWSVVNHASGHLDQWESVCYWSRNIIIFIYSKQGVPEGVLHRVPSLIYSSLGKISTGEIVLHHQNSVHSKTFKRFRSG